MAAAEEIERFPYRITSETRAEALTEGVKALVCDNRSGATALRGSRNRLVPSASPDSIRFGSSWVVGRLDLLRLAGLGTFP